MILAVGIVIGLIAALIKARLTGHSLHPVTLKHWWLVILAFVPQVFAIGTLQTAYIIPNSWIPFILIGTQSLLLVFVFLNRKTPGFWIMGAGLLLNFAVIVANGGWMPVSPETLQHLYNRPVETWIIGERLYTSKDMILPIEQTTLWILSDTFRLPDWIHYRVAFSLGDVVISLGAFWLLFSLAKNAPQKEGKGIWKQKALPS